MVTVHPFSLSGKLITGNSYSFRVSAENSIGVGEPGELSDNVVPKSEFCEHLVILRNSLGLGVKT